MTLLEEIQSKCPAEMIAARNDGEIAATVTAARPPKWVPVSAATVRGAMYAMRVWSGVVQRANAARANADSRPVALACQTLYDLSVGGQEIPMDNPAINSAVSADLALMVEDGLITGQQQNAVLSLAQAPDTVAVADVSAALNGV